MYAETLKSLELTFLATVDQQDWDKLKTLIAPTCMTHSGGLVVDRDAWLEMGKMYWGAFPDAHHVIDDIFVADADRVIVRCMFHGTSKGDFQGMKASGKSFAVPMIIIDRFVDGLVAERFTQMDAVGLMQQIGALPTS